MSRFKVGDRVRFRMGRHRVDGKLGTIKEPTVGGFDWRVYIDGGGGHDGWIAVYEREIELVTEEPEPEETPRPVSLYERVHNLPSGTIFTMYDAYSNGAPWMRTEQGVVDLNPRLFAFSISVQSGVPSIWAGQEYDEISLNVLFIPESNYR